MMRHLLMIFVKFPEPGKVKTRLAKVLGDEEAARIYRKLVARVAENVGSQSTSDETWDIWIVFDPAERELPLRTWLEPLFGDLAIRYVPQVAGDLGERLAGAFAAGFDGGFDRVAAIGTDCVDLDREGISACWRMLEENDIVFGPADDGGYYLIGLKHHRPELFEAIPWSSERTLAASLAVAERSGLSCALLEPLSDLDEIAQWESLCATDASWAD